MIRRRQNRCRDSPAAAAARLTRSRSAQLSRRTRMDAEKEGVQSDMALRSAAVGKTTGRQILCHFPPYASLLGSRLRLGSYSNQKTAVREPFRFAPSRLRGCIIAMSACQYKIFLPFFAIWPKPHQPATMPADLPIVLPTLCRASGRSPCVPCPFLRPRHSRPPLPRKTSQRVASRAGNPQGLWSDVQLPQHRHNPAVPVGADLTCRRADHRGSAISTKRQQHLRHGSPQSSSSSGSYGPSW